MGNLSAQFDAFFSEVTVRRAVSQIEPRIQLRLSSDHFMEVTFSLDPGESRRAPFTIHTHSRYVLAMVKTAAANEFEQQILNNIQRSGWHCNAVGAGESFPTFVYTVGLTHSFGHPELIIIGLAPASAHGILSKIVERLTAAADSDSASKESGPADEPWTCVAVPESSRSELALSAVWYNEGTDFPMNQVVWPCPNGHFPWDEEADIAFVDSQPVLGNPENC